jgi:hypothetical protein
VITFFIASRVTDTASSSAREIWGGDEMKKHCRRVFIGVVELLFVTLWGIATADCQSAAKNQGTAKNPADYAYDLARHLHDANGNYCTKPLSIKEARWLTQYYGAHKSVILRDAELDAAKSMARGKCEQRAVSTPSMGNSIEARSPNSPVPAPAPTKDAIAAAPEKPHVIRIGVAAPDTQIGQSNGMGSVSDPIRSMLIQYLNGPGLEIVPIKAMLPTQIEAEAKEKACEYVLYSSVTQKKGGGIGFLKAASLASSFTPIGAMAGATRAATAAAGTAAAAQAASVSSAVKAKTEYTLTYKLGAPGNTTPVLTNSATAKAKNDGDDVITPLIQQAATAILGQHNEKIGCSSALGSKP